MNTLPKRLATAIAVPLAFLLLVELLLRVGGFGGSYGFFTETEIAGRTLVFPNGQAMRRYFPASYPNPPAFTRFVFEKEKQPGRLRVFVLGASTVQGFPYPANMAFPAFLQEAVLQNGLAAEIVNLSATSLNAVILAEIAAEAAGYQPDHVVLLCGHNEFYGPFGPGSALETPLPLFLKESRLFQLAERLVAGIGDSPPDKDEARTLLARLSQDRRIPLESPEFRAAETKFRRHLPTVFARFRAANPAVRFTVFTPPANLRDFPPVGSENPPAFTAMLQEHGFAVVKKKWDDLPIPGGLRRFLENDPGLLTVSADANYLLGKERYRARDFDTAYGYFSRARDLDSLRLRAPDAIITLLKETVSALPPGTAELIDSERLFCGEKRSPGDGEMTEYLHPTYRMHLKIAETLFVKLFGRPMAVGRWRNFSFTDLIVFRRNMVKFFRDFLSEQNGYINLTCLAEDFRIVTQGNQRRIDIPPDRAHYRFLEKTGETVPSTAETHRLAAEHFLSAGNRQAARDEYAAGLCLHPDNPVFLNNLLVLSLEEGETPRAAACLAQMDRLALDSEPDTPFAFVMHRAAAVLPGEAAATILSRLDAAGARPDPQAALPLLMIGRIAH